MRTRLFIVTAGLMASGCFATVAVASCLPATESQHRANAMVIFEGVALDNPTGTGIQRFRVTRYLKGRGPHVARVDTGFVRHKDGSGTVTSVSLIVKRGERWRIYSRTSVRGVVHTTVCDGSRKR